MNASKTNVSPRVHTLACEAHIHFAIPCLQSLAALSAQKLTVVVHDDGSITESSRDLLLQSLPDARWVSRGHADDYLTDLLSKWPNVSRARKLLPHVMKLIDIGLIEQADNVIRYVDTDMMFFRPFRGLFEDKDGDTSGAFLTDSNSSFGARIGDFKPLGPLRLVRRLNSGLFWIRSSAVDYERIEYLFRNWGLPRILQYGGWFEQAVWANLAWLSQCKVFDSSQMITAHARYPEYTGLVGVHFVTPTRAQLQQIIADPLFPSEGAPSNHRAETIRLLESQPYGLPSALKDAVAFRLRRRRIANG